MKFTTLGKSSNFLAIDKKFSSFDTSRIVVVPAPYEHTVSYGGGTRRGPEGILNASQYVEFYDEEFDRELCNEVGIATLAPLKFGRKVNAAALKMLEATVRELLKQEKFVVTLGGEHTISQAPIAAYRERYPDLSVLQIDAHSDLRDSYQGSTFSHASVMARVCEMLDPSRVVQVGIRAQCIEEARFIRERNVRTFYAHGIRSGMYDSAERTWDDAATDALTDQVYITFDVDGFDPSIMPSTGTPEPNGLYWAETMRLLRKVGERRRIVGVDVVELAPAKGVTHADLTAARLVYKLMNYAFMR
jgi:agmatinase